MRKVLGLIAILLCLPAAAQEGRSAGEPPLPQPRPAERPAEAPAAPGIRPAWTVREPGVGAPVPLPRTRPESAAGPATPAVPPPTAPPAAPGAHAAAPQTPAEPRVYQVACPAVLLGKVEAEALPPISDKQCGAQSPLALTGVLANGRMVPVSGGVTTDCGMASALPEWVEAVDSYLKGKENTEIAEVIVGTSYMCRNVNNGDGGNLSFHAFADAMDVVGFKLADGRTVNVEDGWADALSSEGRLLRYAHDAACSHFTTVLGPEANAEHRDHFHVDLGCHGKTCTARLCE
ncbi:MAG: extensin-like domain-containing protein [Devosia sp.]